MSAHLAWRILVHEKGRTALALGGVFIAILLVFIELGFFIAVPQGGMLVYDHMRFDLLLASTDYQFQAQPWQFPRARLTEAAGGRGRRAGDADLFRRRLFGRTRAAACPLDVFLIWLPIRKARPFAVSDIESQQDTLARSDTILVDDSTHARCFGPLTTGRRIDLDERVDGDPAELIVSAPAFSASASR